DVWPSEKEIPLEERILLLTVRELSIDWGRAIVGRRNAVLNYRRQGESVTPLVKEAAFASDDPRGDLYVVLAHGALPTSVEAQQQLKEELRRTSNEYWAATAVHFVDELPTSS